MNTNKKTVSMLEDVKINVKIKLSALWVTVMLCYAYGDILGFMKINVVGNRNSNGDSECYGFPIPDIED